MPEKFSSNPKYALSKSPKVGVFLGGTSSERSISLKSGRAVYQALKRAGYRALLIDSRRRSRMNFLLKQIDIAFIALHGRGGEDGTMQRFLESRKIPYVGSSPRASLQAFDKTTAKKIFIRKGIPTPAYELISPSDWKQKLARFRETPPYFIKPPREGSSIGAFGVED